MVAAATVLTTGCGAEPAPAEALPVVTGVPRDVVVDTDLGADDAIALVYLLRRPEVRVRAVTVSGTGLVHCPHGAALARALLAQAGQPSIPVACGRTTAPGGHPLPAPWRAAADAAGGLESAAGAYAEGAAELLSGTIRRAPGEVSVLALGPLTNVADALRRGARPTEVMLMGGTIGGRGNVEGVRGAEWNLYADPRSAAVVFESEIPLTAVPLEATDEVPVTTALTGRVHDLASGPDAEWAGRRMTELAGLSFWDPLAAAALVDPTLVETRAARVTVDRRTGALVEAADAGTVVRVAESADRAGLERALLAALAADRG
jgi:inosine-uridine nucleoside N-ribohydrolase